MDLKQLRNFLLVYEHQSITKAASQSFQTQQALSQSIRALEAELQSPLFVRRTKGSIPTDFAHGIHEDVRSLLSLADRIAEKGAQSALEHGKRLSICFANNILGNPDMSLLQETGAFCRERGINFHWQEDQPLSCENDVREGRADCCFSWVFTHSHDFEGELIYSFPNMLVLSDRSPLVHKGSLTPADIAPMTFIYSQALGIKEPSIVRLLSQAGYSPKMTAPVSQLHVMWQMIRENRGITTNYKLFQNSKEYHGVVLKENPFREDIMNFYLFWSRKNPLEPLLRALVVRLRTFFSRLDKESPL